MSVFLPERTVGDACIPAHIAGGGQHLIAAWLGDDNRISPRFAAGDLIVIDRSPAARRCLDTHGTYVVETAAGPRLRYLRPGIARLYFPSEESIGRPSCWESISVADTHLPDFVKGRVVWVSRLLSNLN